jgi:hypothetical protein
VTLVAGVPEIVGAAFGAAVTVIENEGNDLVELPSLTRITMPDVVPTFAAAGVPLNRPVVVLNIAQTGLFWMLNLSGSLSASLAVGWNEYACPTATVVAGVPEILGRAASTPGTHETSKHTAYAAKRPLRIQALSAQSIA